jgi:CRP/FNR family cyclic AMP-dependent transcriptional regulator
MANMPVRHEFEWKDARLASGTGEFFKTLPAGAMRDFESLAWVESHVSEITLFEERQMPSHLFVLLDGQVKLRMDSVDGRRLTLRVAKAGELLGLTSVLSHSLYETTAVTQYVCKVAVMSGEDFCCFLTRHPVAYASVTHDLSADYHCAYERLRTVGLACTTPVKLARLLLEWCAGGQHTESGTRLHLPFTHREIGEFIGASRETISRTLRDFKDRRLVDQHGPTLTIPSRAALECYAQMQAGLDGPMETEMSGPPRRSTEKSWR